LKAADVAALLDIEQIKATAQTEARKIVEEAQAQAEALIAAARQDADALKEQARRDGFATGEEQIQDMLLEIAERSIGSVERTEARIIDLGLEVARRVIGELGPNEATLRAAVSGLGLAARSSFVRVRVAPAAVGMVSERIKSILPESASGLQVDVVPDAQVAYPGAILETDTGLIDATIESQLAAIGRALNHRLGRERPAGG